jgi:REP element-mobilizing transposase RayT
MPRTVREKSNTGVYHAILRGINRQTIFEDEEDATKFVETLGECRKKSEFRLYAYCLMGNHVHFLVKEGREDLGVTVKRVGASYVYWYNRKYGRCGHLFQDRYKSEPVEDDKYFLAVLRYIHQNPVKAGIVKELVDYPWSSYREYLNNGRLVETDFALGLFSDDRQKAVEAFKRFHEIEGQENCLDIDEKRKPTDAEAIELIRRICHVANCKEVQKLDKAQRSRYFRLLADAGLSTRQISRITGIGRWVILNALEN